MEYRGPYRIRTVDKPTPAIEHPHDAIVRVLRSCICGSDLHLYHLQLADRVDVVEGLAGDVARGHVPRVYAALAGVAYWLWQCRRRDDSR